MRTNVSMPTPVSLVKKKSDPFEMNNPAASMLFSWETKGLRGDVLWYIVQVIPQIDFKIVKKGYLGMKTF